MQRLLLHHFLGLILESSNGPISSTSGKCLADGFQLPLAEVAPLRKVGGLLLTGGLQSRSGSFRVCAALQPVLALVLAAAASTATMVAARGIIRSGSAYFDGMKAANSKGPGLLQQLVALVFFPTQPNCHRPRRALFVRALTSRGPVFDPAKVTWKAASTCTPWPPAVPKFSSAPVGGSWAPRAPSSQSGPNGPPQGG